MRGEQFLQPEVFKIHAEEFYKVTFFRVVAVTEDDFVIEVFVVVLKLSFDVGKYCVELIVLFVSCLV